MPENSSSFHKPCLYLQDAAARSSNSYYNVLRPIPFHFPSHPPSWSKKRLSLSQALNSAVLTSLARRKFYDLLDVSPDASEADLKKAYRKKYWRIGVSTSSTVSDFFPIY